MKPKRAKYPEAVLVCNTMDSTPFCRTSATGGKQKLAETCGPRALSNSQSSKNARRFISLYAYTGIVPDHDVRDNMLAHSVVG